MVCKVIDKYELSLRKVTLGILDGFEYCGNPFSVALDCSLGVVVLRIV